MLPTHQFTSLRAPLTWPIYFCLLAFLCWMRLNGQWCLIAIQESGEARYLVIAGVIFLTNNGVLVVIFIPKIKYAKVGITRRSYRGREYRDKEKNGRCRLVRMQSRPRKRFVEEQHLCNPIERRDKSCVVLL
jgi:hypothetical protein